MRRRSNFRFRASVGFLQRCGKIRIALRPGGIKLLRGILGISLVRKTGRVCCRKLLIIPRHGIHRRRKLLHIGWRKKLELEGNTGHLIAGSVRHIKIQILFERIAGNRKIRKRRNIHISGSDLYGLYLLLFRGRRIIGGCKSYKSIQS